MSLERLKKCKQEHCDGQNHGELLIPCDRIQRTSKTYVITGNPTPLNRPRFCGNHVYDSQKHYKTSKIIELQQQHGNEDQFDGVLHFDFTFYFELPKTKSIRNKKMLQEYHNSKPDSSNLIKLAEDLCVDAEIIKDDCRISSLFSRKLYDKGEPRTEFIITQIKINEEDEDEY